jgi:2-polyprenyl-3-methyl-5-hydroxy-6-metoxy-1,4-benzoquinol methylase
MKNSKEYYNSIAETYSLQSKGKMAYLNTIDNLVIEKMKGYSNLNYLDIGSGDGRRSLKIAKNLKVRRLTMLDDSKGMASLLRDKNIILNLVSFFDFKTDEKYDLITCLWNVLGHFSSRKHRLDFFQKIDGLLSKNGFLFFDVNNRYNISFYGFENVMNNVEKDRTNNEENGWFLLKNDRVSTKVYIHNPFDIHEYLNGTSLQIQDTFFVNYESGKIEKTFFEGQLFYVIVKK